MRNHYINFHRVHSKNEFFKKSFIEDKNVFYGKRCLRCQEYLPTSRFKIYHNFLKHYNDGETVVDNKPITVIEIDAIKKFEITFQEHSDICYDFFNSEKLVEEFLLLVKGKIFRSNTNFMWLFPGKQSHVIGQLNRSKLNNLMILCFSA